MDVSNSEECTASIFRREENRAVCPPKKNVELLPVHTVSTQSQLWTSDLEISQMCAVLAANARDKVNLYVIINYEIAKYLLFLLNYISKRSQNSLLQRYGGHVPSLFSVWRWPTEHLDDWLHFPPSRDSLRLHRGPLQFLIFGSCILFRLLLIIFAGPANRNSIFFNAFITIRCADHVTPSNRRSWH
jgi:hypothetical protein